MTAREREDAAVDAIILDALRRDGLVDPEFIANTTMTSREKAVQADLDIDLERVSAKAKRLRCAYTTAPACYDGFQTVTLVDDAGTDDRGRIIRMVGIDPDHWEWQMTRYFSGNHAAPTEEEARRFSAIWRLNV